MTRSFRLVAVLACCSVFAVAHAQVSLPAAMAGTGLLSQDRQVVVPWSITIAAQGPDGTLEGKLRWSGRQCQLRDVPFVGSYRDGVLEISAPMTGTKCGAFTSTLKRTPGKDVAFAGTARIHGYSVSFAVTLAPR